MSETIAEAIMKLHARQLLSFTKRCELTTTIDEIAELISGEEWRYAFQWGGRRFMPPRVRSGCSCCGRMVEVIYEVNILNICENCLGKAMMKNGFAADYQI